MSLYTQTPLPLAFPEVFAEYVACPVVGCELETDDSKVMVAHLNVDHLDCHFLDLGKPSYEVIPLDANSLPIFPPLAPGLTYQAIGYRTWGTIPIRRGSGYDATTVKTNDSDFWGPRPNRLMALAPTINNLGLPQAIIYLSSSSGALGYFSNAVQVAETGVNFFAYLQWSPPARAMYEISGSTRAKPALAGPVFGPAVLSTEQNGAGVPPIIPLQGNIIPASMEDLQVLRAEELGIMPGVQTFGLTLPKGDQAANTVMIRAVGQLFPLRREHQMHILRQAKLLWSAEDGPSVPMVYGIMGKHTPTQLGDKSMVVFTNTVKRDREDDFEYGRDVRPGVRARRS